MNRYAVDLRALPPTSRVLGSVPAQRCPTGRGAWVVVAAVASLLLAACGSQPPTPGWQLNAKGSAERAAQAWLSGDSRVEAVEFNRARFEVASTGRADLVGRLELLRCATRVAALDFAPCTGFDALTADAAPAERAYARYLAGQAQPVDAALLPEPHRPFVANPGAPISLARVQDPLSRLVAAGVLLQRGEASPAVVAQAVEIASAQGWRQPLLAWLQVQQSLAQAAGALDEASRIQRRIDLMAAPAR
jgi:hypothetical protein